MRELLLHIESHVPDDDQRVADMTANLKWELFGSDADSVESPVAVTPGDAKGPGLEWAQLIVGFSGGLPALVALIRSWTSSQHDASVTLELDGDRLVVPPRPTAAQKEAIDVWLRRHGGD